MRLGDKKYRDGSITFEKQLIEYVTQHHITINYVNADGILHQFGLLWVQLHHLQWLKVHRQSKYITIVVQCKNIDNEE